MFLAAQKNHHIETILSSTWEPAHEILVLIALSSNEGSAVSVKLTRASATHMHKEDKDHNLDL